MHARWSIRGEHRAARAAILLAALVVMPARAHGQAIGAGALREGTLSFDGHSTVGSFVGTTTTLTGLQRGGARLQDLRGWVEAPVGTLRTGNERRDRDLGKSMEVERFSTIRFDLTQVVPDDPAATPVAGQSIGAILQGTLTLHGVQHKVGIPARLTFDGATAHVTGVFPVNLKDYGIGGLSKMLGILKMDEHIAVHLDLTFAAR